MLKFMHTGLPNLRFASRTSHYHAIFLLQTHPFSKSVKSIDNSANHSSFVVSYLINSCGFPPEKALSASSYLKFESPEKPDSVLAFLKSHGFTQTQILGVIRRYPPVLLCDPEKTLFPKLQFFKSRGMSSSEVAKMLTSTPGLFQRSLEKHIIPFVDWLNSLLQSEGKTMYSIRLPGRMILQDPKALLIPNIERLKEAGVPNKHIAAMFMHQPSVFMGGTQKFREILEDVKKMGFDPSKTTFLVAVHVVKSTSKSTWAKKLDIYEKWGWSQEDTLAAFRKCPWCMMVSEDKIITVMDYLVNKMGQDPSSIRRSPRLLSMSLQKRIIPRCAIYEVLLSKGLIKNSNSSLFTLLNLTEERFLKFLNSHEEEAPELLKLYEGNLPLAK